MRKEYKDLRAFMAPSSEIINLGTNENHHIDWNGRIKEPLESINESMAYSSYGDDNYTELVNTYAKYAGVKAENVMITNGSEPLIGHIFRSLVEHKVLLLDPDFFRFREYAQLQRLEVFTVSLKDGFDVDETISKINEEKIELFIFSNPNNPLGLTLSQADVEKILAETDCYVVSDEAYMEFSQESAIGLIDKYKKLIIMRTMSKAWGLAGLRIGYGISNPEMTSFLKVGVGPFNISPMTTRIAASSMEQRAYMEEVLQEIIELRDVWVDKLENKYGLITYPTSTNFINVEYENAEQLWEFLYKNNILVSKFPPKNIRISIGSQEEMELLEGVLDKYFK